MLDFGAFSIIAQYLSMIERINSIYDQRYKNLIASLVNYRKSQKITQEQLSEYLGISRQNISKIETCTRRVDVIELNDWLKALGIKTDLIKNIMNVL